MNFLLKNLNWRRRPKMIGCFKEDDKESYISNKNLITKIRYFDIN